MGQDKCFVEFEGEPMIAHVVRALRATPCLSEIVAIGRSELPGIDIDRCLPDDQARQGPLGGLATALAHGDTVQVLVVGTDMPFLQPALLGKLVTLGGEADAVVPRWEGRTQPLCASYNRRLHSLIVERLRRGQLSMTGLLEVIPNLRTLAELEVRDVDPTGLSFRNINRREDLDSL